MSLDTAPIEEDILAVLRTGTPLRWFDGEAPDDASLPVTNGLFPPYGVVYFGGPVRAAGDHGIVSSRHDTHIVYCTVQINAARSSEAKLVKDQAVNLLAGHKPPDAGEMILEGGVGYSRNATNNELPTVYVREVAFTMRSNLAWD